MGLAPRMSPTARSRLGCGLFLTTVGLIYPLAQAPADWRGWGYLVIHGLLAGQMWLVWRAHQQLQLADLICANRRVLRSGCLALLLLLAAPPLTSHDSQRYLWDGRVLLAGENPYAVAPDDPAVATLRRQWPTPSEHARYPTLYPPAALGLFALAASAGVDFGPWLWKILVSLAAMGLLLVTRPRAGGGRHWPLLALSPLLVLEVGVGAHVDVFAALMVALALAALRRGHAAMVGFWLGLGGLIKLLPLVAAWPVAWLLRHRAPRFITALLTAITLGYGGFWLLGWSALGSLGEFFAVWRFGSPLFVVAHECLPAGWLWPGLLLFAVFGMLAVVALVWQRRPLAAVQAALILPLLLSPVVFPWYLLVLLPILARRFSAAVLLWTLAMPLSYEVLPLFDAHGIWAPASWPLWVIASAFLGGLFWDYRAGRLSSVDRVSDDSRPRQASRATQARM